MITMGHVIDNSGKIAKAKPHLAERITRELKIENVPTEPHHSRVQEHFER